MRRLPACLFLAGLISGLSRQYRDLSPDSRSASRNCRGCSGCSANSGPSGWGRYLGDNLGGLAGNFYFGIMLGRRHAGFTSSGCRSISAITFSAANFSYALVVALDHRIDLQTALASASRHCRHRCRQPVGEFRLALFVAPRHVAHASARNVRCCASC